MKINILSIYLVILLTGGGVSYIVFYTGQSISSVGQRLTNVQLPTLNQISSLKHWINENERALYEFYATPDNKQVSFQLLKAEDRIEFNIKHLQIYFNQHPDIQSVETLYQQISLHAILLRDALSTNELDWDAAREELAIISKLGQEALPYLDNLTAIIELQIENSKKKSNKQLSQMSIWVSVFAALILLIALLVGYYIRKVKVHAKEKRRLALFVEKNPNPVACINFNGDYEFENTAWRNSYIGENKQLLTKKVFQQVEKMQEEQTEFSVFNIEQEQQFLELTIHKIIKLDQFMVYVENISEREAARKELEFLAYHDLLTGLPNLKKLEIDLTKIVNSTQELFCLFSFGVKRIQLISTTHGYSVSDALIIAVAARLRKCVEQLSKNFSVCQLFRFTGAKFELILAQPKGKISLKKAVNMVEQLLSETSEKPLDTNFGQFFVDIQSGCAFFPEHGYSAAMLIKNASAALNDAPNNHKERVHLFSHELARREQHWFLLENDLRQADFDNSFYLMYQPKVCLSDGSLVGMEALIRWQHPEKGLISPAEFIPIAEESGIILALGEWILNKAIKQMSQWVKCGEANLQVAVNVSPSQLMSANFVSMVLTCLKEHNLAAHYLEIEITEEVMVEDKTLCIEVLESLKNAGVSIAIDDFGTGYSSLSYLNKLPLSKLKIDRSFVMNIHQNESNLAIVRTIIALSESLNITVIAEGIESKEELAVLNELKCEQGQGYFFSKPLVASDFSKRYIHYEKTYD
ncbi:putative bifunctional diguanylate cyclase/phosphodiesterase [Aliikangiella sp. IMCC44359]|uniref:putative bifunctional diguanylate cyclase/phosphodiesterase n=1 Tax=Aliikangiella sp. IMCC44359 TaxID=3459125 RepID=UPI00403A93A0